MGAGGLILSSMNSARCKKVESVRREVLLVASLNGT